MCKNVGDMCLTVRVSCFDLIIADVSAMLQRGTARTVVGHWGQGFKWH